MDKSEGGGRCARLSRERVSDPRISHIHNQGLKNELSTVLIHCAKKQGACRLRACLISLFGGVSTTKCKKRGKAYQTHRFFSAVVKRHFITPLCFKLKHENHKIQQESGFSSPDA
jgi:hypothetical protein